MHSWHCWIRDCLEHLRNAVERTEHRRKDRSLRWLPWPERQADRQDVARHLGATAGLPLHPAARFQARRSQERHHAADRLVDGTRGHAGYRRIFLEKAVARPRSAQGAKGSCKSGRARQCFRWLYRLPSGPIPGRRHRAPSGGHEQGLHDENHQRFSFARARQ